MLEETEVNPTLVHTPTKCKLCGHIFGSDLLGSAAIVGSNPQAKLRQVEAMVKPLTKHLEKVHPDVIAQAQMTGMEFAGYLMLAKAYAMDDATKEKIGLDFTRWNVHRLTRRLEAHPSDERIRERVQEIFPDDPYTTSQNAVVKLLCEMRDAIEEKDRYTQPVSSNENGKRN